MAFRENFWTISLLLIIFSIFCLVIPIFAWNGELSTKLFIDVATLIISWPVAIALISLIFIFKYNQALDFFLRNIGLMKLPGGVEIQSQQTVSGKKPDEESSGDLVLTPEQKEDISSFIADLESRLQPTDEQKRLLQVEFDRMSYLAIEWKFRFLNLFFVYNTKRVLHWFSTNSPQTLESYYAVWQQIIPDTEHRKVTLDVLLEFGFLKESDRILNITDHGFSFLQFIGIIPPKPTVIV